MAAFQADLPDKHALGDSWGLGWIRYDWAGHRLIGHDGNTIGQSAFLRVLPEQGLVVALLTNGGSPRDLYQDLYREVFAELADVEMPLPLTPPAEPVTVDFEPFLGTYERAGALVAVFRGEDGARLRHTVIGALAEMLPEKVQEYALVPVESGLFVVWSTVGGAGSRSPSTPWPPARSTSTSAAARLRRSVSPPPVRPGGLVALALTSDFGGHFQ
jgi:hypothetical protein